MLHLRSRLELRPRSLHLRSLALLPLSLLACALPTPLGELPTTSSGTTTTAGSTTIDIGVSEATSSAPPEMTSDTGIAEPPPPHAWAMGYAEWSSTFETTGDESGGTGGTSGSADGGPDDGGPAIPPDTLVVQLSTGPDDCDDPHASLECGGFWSITMMIPPELQAPGTYDLLTDLSALVTESGELDGPTCSFGAGMVEGTVELFEVSAQQVTGRLSMVEPFDIDPNGDFIAPRCD